EDRIPIAVSFGHIAPGRAGAQHPKNAVDYSPLVGNGRTPFATIRKQGVENAPFRVRQIAATQCCLPQKGRLESKLDSFLKNRQNDLVSGVLSGASAGRCCLLCPLPLQLLSKSSRSWARRPTSEVTVYAVACIWIDEPKSTKEKMMTARAAEILSVKTCPDKAGQPS